MPAAAGVAQAIAGAWLTRRFAAQAMRARGDGGSVAAHPGVSVLKPLHGAEKLLEAALASTCAQDFPRFQVVFGVQRADDPALAVVERLLVGSEGWLRVAVALAALGGLRSGEARALEIGDVDLAARQLTIRRAFSAEQLADPKGLDERMVPLAGLLVAILERVMVGRQATERVVVTSRGQMLTGQKLGDALRTLQARLGIEPRWHYHQLRHFFATAVSVGGANIETVRRLLGHKDLASTSRYLHATGRDLAAAVAALPGNCGEVVNPPRP